MSRLPLGFDLNSQCSGMALLVPENAQIYCDLNVSRGTRWRSWLRHCATSRKVAGSIPDGVTEIFH